MRTLKFNVDLQLIEQDPNCDFSGLVPGTEGYLQAEFTFSPEWDNYVRVAVFSSALGKEYPPQILKDGKTCLIPAEALAKRVFKVGVVGRKTITKGEVRTLTTNKIEVMQDGGRT